MITMSLLLAKIPQPKQLTETRVDLGLWFLKWGGLAARIGQALRTGS